MVPIIFQESIKRDSSSQEVQMQDTQASGIEVQFTLAMGYTELVYAPLSKKLPNDFIIIKCDMICLIP